MYFHDNYYISNIFTEIIGMAPPINVQDWYGDRHTCQIASGALACMRLILGTLILQELSCRRQTARCSVSLNISLSHSSALEMEPFESLDKVSYSSSVVTVAVSCTVFKGAGSYLAGMAVAIPILNVDGRRHTNNFIISEY